MSRPRLVARLLTAERAVRRWIDQQQGATGITAAGAGVLFTLRQRDHAPVSALAEELGGSLSGVSGLVARLERQGLVTRAKDPADLRTTTVRLTEAGRTAETAARGELATLNARLTAGFTAEEIAVVDRWLAHVGDSGR